MKRIINLMLASILFVAPVMSATATVHKVLRVVDGDTVIIAAPYLPDPLKKQLSLRIYGVDTPEKGNRAKCKAEDELSLKATKLTTRLISSAKIIEVRLIGWDKYGGRVLGDVILDGKSLKDILIAQQLAKEYDGGKKGTWC